VSGFEGEGLLNAVVVKAALENAQHSRPKMASNLLGWCRSPGHCSKHVTHDYWRYVSLFGLKGRKQKAAPSRRQTPSITHPDLVFWLLLRRVDYMVQSRCSHLFHPQIGTQSP
jgi:hypothetical protein